MKILHLGLCTYLIFISCGRTLVKKIIFFELSGNRCNYVLMTKRNIFSRGSRKKYRNFIAPIKLDFFVEKVYFTQKVAFSVDRINQRGKTTFTLIFNCIVLWDFEKCLKNTGLTKKCLNYFSTDQSKLTWRLFKALKKYRQFEELNF